MKTSLNNARSLLQILVVSILIITATGISSALAAPAKPSYEYYVVGSSNDAAGSTSAGQLLMGGGTDVDDAFRWMIGKSGGGDFVVIGVAHRTFALLDIARRDVDERRFIACFRQRAPELSR